MLENFRFGRLDRASKVHNYSYTSQDGADAQWFPHDVTMEAPGSHWSVSIRNYMRATLLLIKSLRSAPEQISSIYDPERFAWEDTNNFVVIELRQKTIGYDTKGRVISKTQRKVEIKVPGHHLEKNSLFIEELGWYIGLPAHGESIREQLYQDVRDVTATSVSIPKNAYSPDPTVAFGDFAPLVRNAIERVDKLRIRVGIDSHNPRHPIPDVLKSLRITVLDTIVSPYDAGKTVYDPTLGHDDLLIESVHSSFSTPLVTTFSAIANAPDRRLYIDTQEHDTLSGVRCGMVVFSDIQAVADYELSCKSTALYEELSGRVIGEAHSYTMRKQIDDLSKSLREKDEHITNLDEQLKFEKDMSKEFKKQAKTHEDTIRRLMEDRDRELSYDMVSQKRFNDRDGLLLEREKLQFERDELDVKSKISTKTHHGTIMKATADILKSTWGILVMTVTVGATLYKTYNKLFPQTA